jgi:hypothetical protein
MPCAHPTCTCDETVIRTPDGRFCCEACAAPPSRDWTSCRCPHPECERTGRHAPHHSSGVPLDIGPTDSGSCASPMPSPAPPPFDPRGLA